MSEETKRILEMLAQGKISVEDADRLMERLAGSRESSGGDRRAVGGSGGSSGGSSGSDGGDFEARPGSRGPLKYLRVAVLSHDGDKVNVRLPLALVRAGVKLTTVLPTEVREKLDQKGVDLSQLSNLEGEELIEALRELNVDVDSKDGDKAVSYTHLTLPTN